MSYSQVSTSGYDLEDDFEAQLAAMEQEIDSQYEAALSSRSNSDIDSILDFGLPAQPKQTPQSNTHHDPFAELAAEHGALQQKTPHTYDDLTIPQANLPPSDSLDHIPISFQDLDSDVETDAESDSLVTVSKGDDKLAKQLRAAGKADAVKGCGDQSCESGACGEKYRIQEELEAKQQAQEELLEAQWAEEIEEYRRADNSLAGFLFNEDFPSFQRALASGRHHPMEFDFKGEHTALHHAVFLELPQFIHELMKYGADINVRNFRGETPLMLACKLEDNLDMLRTIIFQYGADIHIKDHVGLHAFHHAAEQGRVFTLSLLHTVLGVDINVVDIYNKNALHWAAWAGHKKACEFLLRHGCSPYVQDSVGCYPHHWAAAKCRDDVLKLLAGFDMTEGRITGLRTTGEKIYTKRLRLIQFGNKFDFNQSSWVQDPANVEHDPKLLEQKALRRKLDANTLQQYNNDEVYDDFQDLPSYSSIDSIQAVRPADYPGYKPFSQLLHSPNEDGFDVKGFALKKSAHLEGVDRYFINNTTRLIDQLQAGAWFYRSAWGRWAYNEFQRVGYLPVHFSFCYITALLAAFFVFQPLFSSYFPEQLWVLYLFYVFWVLAMYNWWRIVMTTPSKLDFFTPATKNIDAGFGDDGSTTLSTTLPRHEFKKQHNYNGDAAGADDIEAGGANHEDPLASLNSVHSSGASTSKRHKKQHTFQKMEETCQTVTASVCTIDACSPVGHKVPIQRYTIQEYDTISTLHSVYVGLLMSGQANESNCCYTCEIARPLRSKHCGRCGTCVPRFDHHCPFFNQDIAYSNYHNFLWFLIVIPLHWVVLMYLIFKCSTNGLFTAELFPPTYPWLVSGIMSTSTAILVFRLWFFHYIIYVIFDLILFSQHLTLLQEGLTTNEMMNRARYSYLSFALNWNPFSRGSFMYNLLAGLALIRHKEPLCLNDDQCKALKFSDSPLESSWARSVGRRNHKVSQQ